ncbi:unnamed protein product [Scytosiphon promiscuus]
MAAQVRRAYPLIIALLLGRGSAMQLAAPNCDFTMMFSLRSDWGSSDEPCHGKLPFDLWTLMRAEGSALDSDAQYVWENCIQTEPLGLVELTTPEGYIMSEGVEAAPGDIVSETKHASTYAGATAATFEAFCHDENISRVARVTAVLEAHMSTKRTFGRRLKTSLSEAGQAHEVAELIAGLQDLGCTRTTGEDQTVCVISDSFDYLGNAAALQASGDLPQVEVVKELPLSVVGIDEGSAMLELMYDIASGSTYKFNTGFLGEQTFADDVYILNDEKGCDVIVDDIAVFDDPAFRDGMISVAVDDVVEAGSLYFSSAGNEGFGYRFTSNFECAEGFEGIFEDAPGCGTAVPSHVFQPDATDLTRYLYPFTAAAAEERLIAHWDADSDTTEDIVLVMYQFNTATGEIAIVGYGDGEFDKAWEQVIFQPDMIDEETPDPTFQYFLQIAHMGAEEKDIEADFLLRVRNGASGFGTSGESDGSIYGHSCASSCVTVGAIDWVEGDGPGGAFEDPETSPVEDFSSRGPCIVNGETRSKPTTSAANGLSTSSPISGLNPFYGTSAAAPVAAAIATIVRAACFPTVVGYLEIMDMLTNYDYTIDYTNDADGAVETWGNEAGHGIISAAQMLAWVEANCAAACTGVSSTSTSTPTTAPVDTAPPTMAPAEVSTPTAAPADAYTSTPTTTPVNPATPEPVTTDEPRTAAPFDEEAPEVHATLAPAPEGTEDSRDDEDDDEELEDDDDAGYVEIGTKTTVSVSATAYDERPGQDSGDNGCGDDGCLPALAHDGIGEDDIESRWSCSKQIVPGGGQCEIEFIFGSPQDIIDVEVVFWKGDERTRTLKVKVNGDIIGEYESHPGSVSSSLGVQQNDVETVILESVGVDEDEWISLLEVRFMVAS